MALNHPDNTFKSLRDEPTFVERWQCNVGLHRWAMWSHPEKKGGDLYFWQNRFCSDCNYAQRRKVGGIS